jgi:hypothetical protein
MMLSHTRRALEDFDNHHEFERLAADVLNALGYSSVEPMAPRGGADGGRDLKFRSGESEGIAFVTLEKKIRDKFQRDLAKQEQGEGHIALFCNVDVTPSLKLAFTRDSLEIGYTLEVFDLERLRSLLDTSLKEIRRRYLGIDDAVATKLRSEVRKLLRFPDVFPDESSPSVGMLESILANQLPRKLFDLLMRYEERDVREVPGIGTKLHQHVDAYYSFRQQASRVEENMVLRVGQLSVCEFRAAWAILFRYSMMRFGGITQGDIKAGGNFLNYGITWDSAERVYVTLSEDPSVTSSLSELFQSHTKLGDGLAALTELSSASGE